MGADCITKRGIAPGEGTTKDEGRKTTPVGSRGQADEGRKTFEPDQRRRTTDERRRTKDGGGRRAQRKADPRRSRRNTKSGLAADDADGRRWRTQIEAVRAAGLGG